MYSVWCTFQVRAAERTRVWHNIDNSNKLIPYSHIYYNLLFSPIKHLHTSTITLQVAMGQPGIRTELQINKKSLDIIHEASFTVRKLEP